MGIMSIRIDDKKRKALKVIASIEGKTMGGMVSDLIEDYIIKNKKRIAKLSQKAELKELMTLSEISFAEWDNKDDEIYDKL